MASIKRVSETNKEPTKAVLTAEKQKGVRTIYVDNLDGWRDGTNEDTAVPFVMYSKNLTTNEVISGSKTSWLGVVSKSSKTITNLTLTGGEDQLYPAGTAVVATPTAQWANDLADALLTSHNPDGTLKEKVISSRNTEFNAPVFGTAMEYTKNIEATYDGILVWIVNGRTNSGVNTDTDWKPTITGNYSDAQLPTVHTYASNQGNFCVQGMAKVTKGSNVTVGFSNSSGQNITSVSIVYFIMPMPIK